MKRVIRIEKGKPPRVMQFSDQMWDEIRKLNLGDVTWELAPVEPPAKVTPPPPVKPVEPPPIQVIEYNKVKTEPVNHITITSQPLIEKKPEKEKKKRTPKAKKK